MQNQSSFITPTPQGFITRVRLVSLDLGKCRVRKSVSAPQQLDAGEETVWISKETSSARVLSGPRLRKHHVPQTVRRCSSSAQPLAQTLGFSSCLFKTPPPDEAHCALIGQLSILCCDWSTTSDSCRKCLRSRLTWFYSVAHTLCDYRNIQTCVVLSKS